jgi:hypothetical protein
MKEIAGSALGQRSRPMGPAPAIPSSHLSVELDHLEDPGPTAISGTEAARAADRLMQGRSAAGLLVQTPVGQQGRGGRVGNDRPFARATERPDQSLHDDPRQALADVMRLEPIVRQAAEHPGAIGRPSDFTHGRKHSNDPGPPPGAVSFRSCRDDVYLRYMDIPCWHGCNETAETVRFLLPLHHYGPDRLGAPFHFPPKRK